MPASCARTPAGHTFRISLSAVTVPNPTTIDITLRSGLVYSNGTPLDANAVKAGWERNMTNPHPGVWDQSFSQISSIDVTGPHSLVLTFSQPVASSFYPHLADQESFMALPTGPSSGSPNENVVGAGPFVLKSFVQGEKIVLVKNPKYWDAKAIDLAGITFVNVPSGPQQLNSIESGLVDVEGIPDNDIPALKNLSDVQSTSLFPDASYYFVPICKASGPLANVKVRQALNYATNRVAINNALFFGKGQPAWSIFPSSSSDYDSALTNDYAYNVKKAEQLLTQAGYPHGFSTSLMPLPQAENTQLATVLQQQWKQIGVNVQIVQASNYVTDLYTDNKAQMGLNPEGLPGIQKLTTQYIPGDVGDLCNYNNPTLNNLTKEVEALPPSSPKLRSTWVEIQKFVAANALSVYVDYAPEVTAAQEGRDPSPGHSLRWRGHELLDGVSPRVRRPGSTWVSTRLGSLRIRGAAPGIRWTRYTLTRSESSMTTRCHACVLVRSRRRMVVRCMWRSHSAGTPFAQCIIRQLSHSTRSLVAHL